MLAAIDRGSLARWRRIAAAVRADPSGPAAADLDQALGVAEDVGVAATLRRAFTRAREDTEAAAREEVRLRLQALVENSSLTAAQFARRLGTSASRMSTYLTGKVVPSAALLVGNETVSNCAVQARSRTERMGVRGRNR